MLENLNDSSYLEPPEIKKEYVYKCDICDEEIFEGDNCYKIDDIVYCPECMGTHLQIIAETIDIEAFLADLENEEVGD